MEVLKLMVFNTTSERFFLKFKQISENMFLIDDLSGETATLDKRLDKSFNPK